MEWRLTAVLTRSHSSYPWNGAGGTGLKTGRTIGWSNFVFYIEVNLRVRRIPVCWKHLEFWETFCISIFAECCIVLLLFAFWASEHATALQPSERVIRASR